MDWLNNPIVNVIDLYLLIDLFLLSEQMIVDVMIDWLIDLLCSHIASHQLGCKSVVKIHVQIQEISDD